MKSFAAPVAVASEPQIIFPLASVSSASEHERIVESVNPPPVILRPFATVEVLAPVTDKPLTESPPLIVEVPIPVTTSKPVVVAPPEMVRPVVVEPPPIVVEAWKIFAPVKVLLVVVVNAAPDCSQYAADEVAKKLRANLHASDEVVENERPSEV